MVVEKNLVGSIVRQKDVETKKTLNKILHRSSDIIIHLSFY